MTPEMVHRETRAFWVSAAGHAVILGIMVVAGSLRACSRPSPPREIVTFIDVAASAPPSVAKLPELTRPAPEPPRPRPTPQPRPAPESKPVPQPEPRPQPPPSEPRPRPTPERPAPSRPSTPAPSRPALTPDQIREHLARGFPSRTSAQPDDFPFGWYFALVRQALYEAWVQPSGLSASSGLTVLVRIRVERDGTISRREIVRPSGNPAMDESVRRALDAVRRLRPLPETYRGTFREITVEFALTDAGG